MNRRGSIYAGSLSSLSSSQFVVRTHSIIFYLHKPTFPNEISKPLTSGVPILSEPLSCPSFSRLLAPPTPEPQALLTHLEPTCLQHLYLAPDARGPTAPLPRSRLGTATSTAHVRKSVSHAGSLTREELPLSFRPGLSRLELPGSREKLAGRRTRAQGFLGHVVVEFLRLYFEGALNSLGLHVPQSQSSVTFVQNSAWGCQERLAWGRLLVPTTLCGAPGACWDL